MASPEAKAETDRHRAACIALSAFSPNPEIKTLSRAIEDSNKWLDASFTDLQNILHRLSVVESSLVEANEEIRRLKALLQK